METQTFCVDSVVNSVIMKFITRSNVGIKKYGVTLDREDLEVSDWILHAQEEHMDAILYLEKLKMKMNNKSCNCKCSNTVQTQTEN